jgi:hypothetical protein
VFLPGDGQGQDWKNRTNGVRIALKVALGSKGFFGARQLPAEKSIRNQSGSGMDWEGTVFHSMSRKALLRAICDWLNSDAFRVHVTADPADIFAISAAWNEAREEAAEAWNSTIGLRGNSEFDGEQIELVAVRGPY